MKFSLALIILFGIFIDGILVAKKTTDYCKSKLCKYGTHVACDSKFQTWGYSCPLHRKMIRLDNKTRAYLTKLHNSRRNYIAGGKLRGYEKACRMTTMQWNKDLAELAGLNVRQCEMRHNDCHNTIAFKYSGQNLSKWQYSKPVPTLKEFLRTAVKQWFLEYKNCNQNMIDNYPSYYGGPVIGHFTSMVHERNTHLGCAISTWQTMEGSYMYTHFLLACNYATTNYSEFPIYKSCKKAGSQCKTGRHKQYSNLCSIKETPRINVWIKNGQRYY